MTLLCSKSNGRKTGNSHLCCKGDCTINNTELMKMSEEVVTFVFFTYFSQNFLEGGRTTKIAELINEAVVARATRGRSKTTLTFS